MESATTQSIKPDEVYPVSVARQFFGGERAWREARRKGLAQHIRFIGRRGFIRGSAIIEIIESAGKIRDYATGTN